MNLQLSVQPAVSLHLNILQLLDTDTGNVQQILFSPVSVGTTCPIYGIEQFPYTGVDLSGDVTYYYNIVIYGTNFSFGFNSVDLDPVTGLFGNPPDVNTDPACAATDLATIINVFYF